MNDKHIILDETEEIINPDDGMNLVFLRNVFVALFLILMAVFPKIFINSQIYFKSREISTLSHEHDALEEENRLIRTKVETLKYKHQVSDTLF